MEELLADNARLLETTHNSAWLLLVDACIDVVASFEIYMTVLFVP